MLHEGIFFGKKNWQHKNLSPEKQLLSRLDA
jgi:hypothetical protein